MECRLAYGLMAVSIPIPISEDCEETRWIARAIAGEEAAHRWLLERYRQRAVRLAAHVLRRSDEAEDVAQEAFIRAFRSLRNYRGDGRFYTWLYHIVVRTCIDRQRLARWNRETPLEQKTELATIEDDAQTRLLVEALLDRLSPTVRAALVLFEIEGLEYQEIAEVLDIPVGTVRSRLNSARAQFRAMYSAAMKETADV